MYFSSRELESRYERVYNEEHAQSDVLATSLMMACCAINWLVLSQPYGRHIHAVQSAALISLTIGSIFMQVLAVGWPGLYKRHRTVLMASLRVVCNAVTTATYVWMMIPTGIHGCCSCTLCIPPPRMPAYHQYLAANMPGNTQLVRIVHLLVDGMPIVPAFVALVFPILWHTHLWLLISAHAHLVLSQWFDCVTLVASPILSAAYSAPDVDVVTQPTAALSAVRYCRRVNIVGQVLSLLVSGIYSWYVLMRCYTQQPVWFFLIYMEYEVSHPLLKSPGARSWHIDSNSSRLPMITTCQLVGMFVPSHPPSSKCFAGQKGFAS